MYIGFTSDLVKRVWQHKEKMIAGFTKRYSVDRLMYFEQFDNPNNAIKREKRLKKYKRQWKIDLIETDNPDWKDLYFDLTAGYPG